jgi:D-apionolactonase
MPDTPSRAICLFGTEEEVPPPRLLRAGQLTVELDGGNLRYIRFGGAEVLRAISFIVRDKDWGTYNPVISALSVDEGPDRFVVTFSAVASDADQRFDYVARIEGTAAGTLTFAGKGASPAGFLTNRTGFVVLHPIDGISGAPVEITHTDGRLVASVFPDHIDPVQPMSDLRQLSHRTPDGLTIDTLMEGDTYEMEDQRNWTDASYKTYVRPLALPWPYRLSPGEMVDQAVRVTIRGSAATAGPRAGAPVLKPGAPIATVPPLGLGLRPEDAAATLAHAAALRQLGAAYVLVHHDPRAGHDATTLQAQLDAARALGAAPWLEAIITAADTDAALAEVADLGRLAAVMGRPFSTVLVSPAPDLKCTLPGSIWPPAPDAARLYAATRAAFVGARIGGGMFSYFTELNRKRPPPGALDLVSFTTSPMVHAGDDRSVMETHEAHGAIIRSVAAIAGGTPWAVGPSAIGVRDNPYGVSAKMNPGNIRQAMNWNDPRQRGLFGAVWNLGYFADFAIGGAAAIALGAPVGPFGTVSAPTDFDQPWFKGQGELYPVFHVLRGLARLRDRPLLRLPLSPAQRLAGCAAVATAGTELWVGNMSPGPVTVRLPPGGTGITRRIALLDEANFVKASADPVFMDRLHDAGSEISLSGHAILRVVDSV